MRTVTSIFLLGTFVFPLSVMSESFLSAETFPSTVDDLSFSAKVELDEDSYKPFAGLDSYQILEIIETDRGIVEEMEAADIIDADQSANTSFSVDTSSSSNQITIQSTVNYSGGYCAIKNDALSSNQNIPIGKPVFHNDYKFCSKYGWRNFGSKETPSWDYHHGFDIGCTLKHYGRPVFATANGTVERAQPNSKGSSAGNYIVINHGGGFKTKYMHLKTIMVKKGQSVQAGCQIGEIGNTGGAKKYKESFKNNPYPTMSKNAAHLHYEIHYTGNQSSISANGTTIEIKKGRETDPNTVKDDSVDPSPFMNAK